MNTNVAVYLGSYSLSLLGNGIASVVLPLLVLARTGDVMAAGIVASVAAATAAIAGVFAGVVIDRVNRRTVSIACDLLSASAVAALPLVDAVWGLDLAWFVLLAVIGALGDSPGMTARETLLPRVVQLADPREGGLDRIIGIRESLVGVLLLAGPGLGGLLVAVFGVDVLALLLTAGTSCAAAGLTLALDRRAGEVMRQDWEPASVRSVWIDLRTGWCFLATHRMVLAITLVTAVFIAVIAAMQTTLLPAYFSAERLPGMTGLALTALSIGGLIGAGVYAATVGKVTRRTWFAVGMVGAALGAVGLGALWPPWTVIVSVAFVGLTNGPVSAVLGVALINATPDRLRGRVLGAQNAIVLGAPAAAVAPFGIVASTWGLSTAGVVFTVVIVVTAIVSLSAPVFRTLDHPPQ